MWQILILEVQTMLCDVYLDNRNQTQKTQNDICFNNHANSLLDESVKSYGT